MSHAPCTLFCPRSGLTPPPGTPMLPSSICRFARSITLRTPTMCWVMPIAQITAIGLFVAMNLGGLVQLLDRHAGDLARPSPADIASQWL